MPTQRIPELAMIPFQWRANTQKRRGERCEIDGQEFSIVEPAAGIEQADAVARDQAAEGVADDREFCYVVA